MRRVDADTSLGLRQPSAAGRPLLPSLLGLGGSPALQQNRFPPPFEKLVLPGPPEISFGEAELSSWDCALNSAYDSSATGPLSHLLPKLGPPASPLLSPAPWDHQVHTTLDAPGQMAEQVLGAFRTVWRGRLFAKPSPTLATGTLV